MYLSSNLMYSIGKHHIFVYTKEVNPPNNLLRNVYFMLIIKTHEGLFSVKKVLWESNK